MISPLLRPREAEGREKLTPYQWRKRREELCTQAHGRCQRCTYPTTLSEGHAHHKERRGLGGGKRNDSLSNLEWLCQSCHIKEHQDTND